MEPSHGSQVFAQRLASSGFQFGGQSAGGLFDDALGPVLRAVLQGAAPENWNFVNLTVGTGEFREFTDVTGLRTKYGSMLGLLKADPFLIPKLILHSGMETIRFPLGVGADSAYFMRRLAAGAGRGSRQ